jgi:AcrR family transcriptional regulator
MGFEDGVHLLGRHWHETWYSNEMVVSRQDAGRINQKRRTRRAIIDAAAELVRENKTPSVADAAERALVSRATAYRYFPSQQSLLVEVQADATQPSVDDLLADAGPDIEVRVEAITRALTRMVLADEALFRNQIRSAQDAWFARHDDTSLPVREGRRLAWIDKALEPAKSTVDGRALARLRNGLAVVVGVEPVVGLRDICGLSPKATEESLVWTARSLVHEAGLATRARRPRASARSTSR